MAHFGSAVRPEELIALAWHLEAGSRAFYAAIAGEAGDRASAALYEQLVGAEERHMAALTGLYRRIAGAEAAADFPAAILPQEPAEGRMEGGVEVARALAWSRGKPPGELLEYCVALETNSYDLYLRMRTATAEPEARGVFDLLAAEERRHLELLSARLERGDAGDRGRGGEPPP